MLNKPKVAQIIENREATPDELFKLLALNEETIDFILDYPSKRTWLQPVPLGSDQEQILCSFSGMSVGGTLPMAVNSWL